MAALAHEKPLKTHTLQGVSVPHAFFLQVNYNMKNEFRT